MPSASFIDHNENSYSFDLVKDEIQEGRKTEDPEDVFSTSLDVLYGYAPITCADAGSVLPYTYSGKDSLTSDNYDGKTDENFIGLETSPIMLTLHTSDTRTHNWALHASSIWASSIFLADHVGLLELRALVQSCVCSASTLEVLELGAGAGLPGLMVAKCLERASSSRFYWGSPDDIERSFAWRVTLSDYPDDLLIDNLRANAQRNGFAINETGVSDAADFVSSISSDSGPRVRVVPYAWGDDVSPIRPVAPSRIWSNMEESRGYDLILASDTLWNSSFHGVFLYTLHLLLRRTPHARVHLVAGLHTGRYTIRAFLNLVRSGKFGLDILKVEEYKVDKENFGRAWAEEREGEEEGERRRWLVWIILGWASV